MVTPKDITPNRYEVLKTRSGAEIVGMTRDTRDHVEITLPMICHLSMIPGTGRTQCIFYPYAPLSAEEKLMMPKDHIVHRSKMNEQFIPHYDNASSTWFEMIAEESIPLNNPKEIHKDLDRRIREAMHKVLGNHDPDIFDLEEYDLRDTGITLDDHLDDFLEKQPPKNKKKLH